MGFGPMGFGVAGALGAKLAAPGRPCVAVVGDGAFLDARERAGDGVRVQHSGGLRGVEQLCVRRRSAGCSAAISAGVSLPPISAPRQTNAPYNPDFAAMARSAGVDGASVDRAADLAEADTRRHRERHSRTSSTPTSTAT